jgi:hypothetical protein
LDAAECVVVLWSKQSIDSEWVLEDANQRWCWSADKRSSGSAWNVYFRYGDARWDDLLGSSLYVRGVRS